LFPLIHKELTESEFELLKPNISKAYIIDNFNTDASQFVETSPESFIDKYNELYANQDIVRQLTAKLPSGSKENVIARITWGYSLQKGKRFSTAEFNIYDSKEKSIKTF